MKNKLTDLLFSPGKLFIVENYLEAVVVMKDLQASVVPASPRRLIDYTKIVK